MDAAAFEQVYGSFRDFHAYFATVRFGLSVSGGDEVGHVGGPAVAEAVAVAVHLQDMDVVGEPVRAEHLGTPGTTFVLSEVPVGWNTTRATRFPPD